MDGAGEVGKKLDFLPRKCTAKRIPCFRENTRVESEALAVTGLALEIKAEIEKLREQVQNLE